MSGNSSRPALFFARFRRITSTNEYLPEIDGLRFISIFLVAFLFHPVGGYIVGDLLHGELPSSPFVNTFIKNGAEGVTFFFIISGFILTLPFARGQMQFGPNNLKKYFLRRLTRIEPPYIISLTLIFLIRLLISGKEPFSWLFPHYLSSLFYLSNVFYNQFPFINGVTWSLEVEIQFYILLPFFSLVYFRLRPFTRRILLCLLALLGVWHLYSQELVLGNIGHHGCHFICGILLADLYVNKKLKLQGWAFAILALIILVVSCFVPGNYSSLWESYTKFLLLFIFFLLALNNKICIKYLSWKPIAIIGGMCYSIYLVHMPVIGFLRHNMARIELSAYTWLNITFHYLLLVIIIVLVSSLFFLWVEKPTMRKEWYLNIFKRKGDNRYPVSKDK